MLNIPFTINCFINLHFEHPSLFSLRSQFLFACLFSLKKNTGFGCPANLKRRIKTPNFATAWEYHNFPRLWTLIDLNACHNITYSGNHINVYFYSKSIKKCDRTQQIGAIGRDVYRPSLHHVVEDGEFKERKLLRWLALIGHTEWLDSFFCLPPDLLSMPFTYLFTHC